MFKRTILLKKEEDRAIWLQMSLPIQKEATILLIQTLLLTPKEDIAISKLTILFMVDQKTAMLEQTNGSTLKGDKATWR